MLIDLLSVTYTHHFKFCIFRLGKKHLSIKLGGPAPRDDADVSSFEFDACFVLKTRKRWSNPFNLTRGAVMRDSSHPKSALRTINRVEMLLLAQCHTGAN